MSKVVQISILAKISGNVNADESIGTRITLKKMYSSDGSVLPFVSARAIKYAIREGLKNRGYEIDPFVSEGNQLNDFGDPEKYIDNDLFGYLTTEKGKRKGEGGAKSRQAPIALSYLKAIYDTPISTEFAARFPREENQDNPVPFEIEVAEFIGRLNAIIYDYVGKKGPGKKEKDFELRKEEREKRLRDFLDIFLTPSYVLPRRTNSLNIPEYIVSLVVLSENGPKPIYQYLDYEVEERELKVKEEKLNQLIKITEKSKCFLINYNNAILPQTNFEIKEVKEAIDEIIKFYFS
ncbi:MAG: type I-B CRISPR-associated protein Cas7/Cst2/DevR [Candidatus Aenigmatarchaeota archaeon]